LDELIPVGRVGRPHGVDGAFFVEEPSGRDAVFAVGAAVWMGGRRAQVVVSRRGGGNRPVIRLDRPAERGALLAVPRADLPALGEDEYYAFELVGLAVEEEGGRFLGRVADVVVYPANDVLELDSGMSLPLVGACVRSVDVEGGRIVIAPGFAMPE
jgi:16S rRNA processing protein RimM